jgi:hypothetical protein
MLMSVNLITLLAAVVVVSSSTSRGEGMGDPQIPDIHGRNLGRPHRLLPETPEKYGQLARCTRALTAVL